MAFETPDRYQMDIVTGNFDASSFASGVYIYTIKANNFVQSKKMILMK